MQFLPEEYHFFRQIFLLEENTMSKQRISTRYMAVIAMFSAISFIAVLLGKVIPNVAGFLSYDPKDAVIAIAGFLLEIGRAHV